MKKFNIAILVLVIFSLAACSKNNPVAPKAMSSQGKIRFAMDVSGDPANKIVSGQVTITKGSITEVLPITITNRTGTVEFDSVQVGTWQIKVQLFDSAGNEIYTGTGNANVTPDQTTTVSIQVNSNFGTLQITVLVPSPMIDNFDNDSSLDSTLGQRDGIWWAGSAYTLSIVSNFAGDNTPCLQVNYNIAYGCPYIAICGLDAPGKYHNFSATQHVSAKVYGPISLLIKFQDKNRNESADVSTQTASNPGWTTLTWDLSNQNWQQCDATKVDVIEFFAQPGQGGVSGTFYLDDLMGDDALLQ